MDEKIAPLANAKSRAEHRTAELEYAEGGEGAKEQRNEKKELLEQLRDAQLQLAAAQADLLIEREHAVRSFFIKKHGRLTFPLYYYSSIYLNMVMEVFQ
jgi:hypothetical protein